MGKARLGFSSAHVETAVAILSFGGSSVYWLALAFAMSTDAYGRMMTLQAVVLVVVMVFTFRTHDLFFNLIAKHGCPAHLAYRRTLLIELVAGAAAVIVCTISTVALGAVPMDGGSTSGIGAFALVASLGVLHGSSIGKLRYLTRGDIIAKSDMLAALAWAAAFASIPLVYDAPAVVPLIIGSTPAAVRTLVLLFAVRRIAPRASGTSLADEASPVEIGGGMIVRFLAGAQITNFLKNASVPLETLILAVFTPPAIVAMYRVARAVQGASNAALNVSYQRFYPILAEANSRFEQEAVARRLRRNSLLICLLVYPASALAGLGYSLLKPDVGVIELQLMTVGTFLALLPAALQQGAIAILLIEGDHRSVGTAYVLSFLFLGAVSLFLFLSPRVEIFFLGLVGGAFIRLWHLNIRSRVAGAPARP